MNPQSMTLIDVSNEAGRVSIRIYVGTEWIIGLLYVHESPKIFCLTDLQVRVQ